MTWNPLAIQTCTFLAVSGLVYLAFRAVWSMDRRVQDRLIELSNGKLPAAHATSARMTGDRSNSMREKVARTVLQLMPGDEQERNLLQARLLNAGIYAAWAPNVFVTAKIILILAPPLIGFLLGELGVLAPHRALFYGGVAGGMGIVIPNLWLDQRKRRRQGILLRSLPDFLDLLVTCVQSGMSLNAALQRVTDELAVAHPVLAGEMAVVQRQIELGASPDLALRSFAERSDLAAVLTLSTLIEQARRFGTSISEALRTHAEVLRYQREQSADELAQKAAVKILFPTLVFIFPAIFVVIVGPAAVQIAEKFSTPPPAAVRHK